jgi:hypothetical protein
LISGIGETGCREVKIKLCCPFLEGAYFDVDETELAV